MSQAIPFDPSAWMLWLLSPLRSQHDSVSSWLEPAQAILHWISPEALGLYIYAAGLIYVSFSLRLEHKLLLTSGSMTSLHVRLSLTLSIRNQIPMACRVLAALLLAPFAFCIALDITAYGRSNIPAQSDDYKVTLYSDRSNTPPLHVSTQSAEIPRLQVDGCSIQLDG